MQHLQKSRNILCIAANQNLRENLRGVRPRPEPSTSQDRSDSESRLLEEQPARDFEGDFYGNDYVDADFPFPEDGVPLEGSDRVDVEEMDLEDDGDVGSDGGFEEIFEMGAQNRQQTALREHPGHEDAAVEVLQDEMDVDEGEGGAGRAPGGISVESHSRLKVPPIFITKFKGQAGKTISRDSSDNGKSYSNYVERLDGSEENIWAPFNSKIDWEVSQWAKLRGPGSTAFTEFLEIEGVH